MPPVLSVVIDEYVGGDDLSVERTVTSIPVGRTITKAWLTIKAKPGDADPGIVSKIITVTPVVDVGQITDPGADGTGTVLFFLTPEDTQTTLTVGKSYAYDIQVKFDSGEISTLETSEPDGYIRFARGVTDAVA